jgi:hypothetical protein
MSDLALCALCEAMTRNQALRFDVSPPPSSSSMSMALQDDGGLNVADQQQF